jgi:hypothetical protein
LRTTPAGDEPEGGAAVPEDGVGVSDAKIAGQRQVESAAHTVSVNSSADGGREVVDKLHETLSRSCELEGVGAEGDDFIQVSTGREESMIASEDQWFGVDGKSFYRLG